MSKNVVITGANRGIGLAMTQHFLQKGYTVYAACRTTSSELTNTTAHIISGVEVATPEGINNLATGLSGISVDVLVCNAGILRDESLGELNLDTIRQQYEVNAIAPLNVVDTLQSQLVANGKVAMITSRMGSITDNGSGGRYGYRMSKAALNAASMSLSHDLLPRNIAVGIFHPGYVQTDMVNNNGDISAEDSALKLVNLIEALTIKETGVFKHSNGQVLPW